MEGQALLLLLLQLFCRCALSRLSTVPAEGAPPTPLPLELLTALRIVSRECSGLDDLLCGEGVGVVLQRAGLRGGAVQSGFGEKDKLEIDSACACTNPCMSRWGCLLCWGWDSGVVLSVVW